MSTNQHHHGYVYRTQHETDRVISQFGRKPSEETRERLRTALYQQKERFHALENVRTHQQQRVSGRSMGRER